MQSEYGEMGKNHQQQRQQQHKFNNGEVSHTQDFFMNQTHQYNHQQPYMFQEVHNLQTTQDFFHYHRQCQALLQQQRRLQDQQHCVLGQSNVIGNNIRPSVPCFPLNFKPDINENITRKDGGLCDGGEDGLLSRSAAASAQAMASPHYFWQNQEDSAIIRQPFWKSLPTDLSSDGSNKTKDKEVLPEMNPSRCYRSSEEIEQMNTSLDQNGKPRLFSELEAICRNASIASEANGTGGASAENLATTTTTCLPVTLDNLNSNAGTTAAAIGAGIGHDHDGSETSSGEEAPLRMVQKIKKGKKLKDELCSMAIFFDGLLHQLMDYQETIHWNFMEAIEGLDKERKEREEAWRRQELEKLQQDAAAKARERALASCREASIVSYLEKITGQTIKLSSSNPPSNFQPTTISSRAINVEFSSNNKAGGDDLSKNIKNRRWHKAEVEALIKIRSNLEQKFRGPGSKGPLWEEISNSMASMGYQRSAKRCKEKWENINKYFKKSRENSNECRKKLKKTCQYFDQLDRLYSKSVLVNGGSYSCSSSSEPQAKPSNENQLPIQTESLVPAGNFKGAEFKSTLVMDFNEEEEADGNAESLP